VEFETILAVLKVLLSMQYFAIWLIMFLDATVSPLPGETLLVFAGYLIYLGQLNMFYVVLAAAIGSTLGALVVYELARAKGEEWLLKYGRFVFLKREDISTTKRWFAKHGQLAVIFGRFIPMISQLISIPAGLAKMSRAKFLLYTFAGSFVYLSIVTYIFYLAGGEWNIILQYLEPIQLALTIIVGAFFIAVIAKGIVRRWKDINSN
jgi:membrane protein DedA with SNARE-associated domain